MGNFVFTSQSKVFVDANAGQAIVGSLSGSAGAGVQIPNLANMEVDVNSSAEAVPAIGINGGAGFKFKQGGGTITLTENRMKVPVVPWRQYVKERKQFMMFAEDENGGMVEQWVPCTVSKVSRTLSAEGEHQDKIEIVFLNAYY